MRRNGFFVSEPQSDNLEGNSGLKQMHGASMPQGMRGDGSSGQRWALRGCFARRQRQTVSYAVTGKTIPEVEKDFDGKQYGHLKVATAEAVIEFLRPVQARYAELTDDPAEVERRLKAGADAAESIAEPVLQRAMNAAGLLPRP